MEMWQLLHEVGVASPIPAPSAWIHLHILDCLEHFMLQLLPAIECQYSSSVKITSIGAKLTSIITHLEVFSVL